jgi:hypothetical protein
MLGPFDRCLELRPSPNHRSMNGVIRRVAAQDFVYALIQSHLLAGWPRGHVGEGERVHDRSLLDWEGGQLVDQAALLGLEACPGVMGDKTGQPLPAMGTKEVSTIDRMEAKPIQRRGIADIMQERRCYQHVTILGREDHRHPTRLASDRLDMRPTVAQRCDQPFNLCLCPWFQRHDATIPERLTGRGAVVLAA